MKKLAALLPAAAALFTASFLSLSLAAGGDAHWIVAAAACYFLAKVAEWRRFFITSLAFLPLAFFNWGALLAGALLFAALLAEAWGRSSRCRQGACLVQAALCIAALLFACVPGISLYAEPVALPLPLLAAAALLAAGLEAAAQRTPAPREALDPLLTMLLAAAALCYLLAVGLLASRVAFPQAILLAAAGGCSMLALVVVLTLPARHGGSMTFFQHLFAPHVPVEKWMADVSALAAREDNAEVFASGVVRLFLPLPGVVGATWRLNEAAAQSIGAAGRQRIDLQCPPLFLSLHLRRRVSSWDWFNYYLLARIGSEYCLAKQREEQSRADNLNRAIHQAGACLTHDIKNILHTLSALAQTGDDALVRRQLPSLCERLEQTLAKLQLPSAAVDDDRLLAAAAWWERAQARHLHQPVRFAAADASADAALPAALFDLALDNFIANALIKRQADSGVEIHASLAADGGGSGVALRVCDTGAPLAEKTAAALFRQPVESVVGFGVALYQVRLEAEKRGYAARLAENREGSVVFELRAVAPAPPS